MPGEVGAGSFWREMVEWTNGKPADDGPRGHRGELARELADAVGWAEHRPRPPGRRSADPPGVDHTQGART